MAYFISPLTLSGIVGHHVALQANLDSSPVFPTNFVIQWRKNGASIKQGPTSNSFFLSINNAGENIQPFGVNFTANDAGSEVDFILLDPVTFVPIIDPMTLLPLGSQGIILGNNLPVISGAGVVTDAYNLTPGQPTLVWTYSDADNDPQYAYRVRIGSGPLGSDYFDSGQILSATTFSVTSSSPAIPAGTTYYWTIDVSDGQKINPLDISPNPPLILVTAAGIGKVNTPPIVSNVKIDGTSGGVKIQDNTPTITWTYYDVDTQPQQSYRIIVAKDIGLTQILWDSGSVLGAATSSVYNFNLTGVALTPHILLYVGVSAADTFVSSATTIETFKLSVVPVINGVFVDTKVNPLNVRELTPTFNWNYAPPEPLTAYEIRVADNSINLGTDSFIGTIWNPGVKVTPESYSTIFNFDGTAFSGCEFPKNLQSGIIYYFQVQIQDGFEKSAWATGYFKLNAPPTAINLQIFPPAPFNSDDLFASYQFVDDVGDVEDLTKTQIRWYQKSVTAALFSEVASLRNTKTVPNALTIPGDEWKFTVQPSDGDLYSLLVYTSGAVTILNRAPTASALILLPTFPKTTDNLQAQFSLSDPDEDPVVGTISWFKNNIEQIALRNSQTIPASVTSIDEQWYFTVLPNDGYVNGPLATSNKVTILNTPPTISSISVDGAILPRAVKNQNPTISWMYQDEDLQPQQKFQVLIGTKPVRTTQFFSASKEMRALPQNSSALGVSLPCDGGDGIISKAKNGVSVIAGNEIFDSGVITSGAMSFQYLTEDFVQNLNLTAITFTNLNGYFLEPDFSTLGLQPNSANGTAVSKFNGQDSLYDVTITYIKEDTKRSTYRLIVDGIVVGQFTSQIGTGSDTYTFNAIKLNSGSSIGIAGIATDSGAKAQFQQLTFTAITQLTLNAGDFNMLSGYLQDGTGGIKLAGVAGTATTPFNFPSGTYDVEFVYQTETNGNPNVMFSINSSVLLNFAYESGARVRSRFLTGVSINRGDIIKISGTRNAGAVARVKQIIFKPTQTIKTGSKLKEGLQYFASVRVFDSRDWSNWYTTEFTMAGSAWAANVSNALGWTIEARFNVTPTN